jgi:ribosomal protein L11 methyltransferase
VTRFVRLAVRARGAVAGELVPAVAIGAGASGLEERASDAESAGGGSDIQHLWVYTDVRHADSVAAALRAHAADGIELGASEPVAETDWSQAWREGMTAIEISPRLVVAPSFLAHTPRAGQALVTIDPGQAFGTGGHASTRLALILLAALPAKALSRARVLDAGTGSGVLALAALALGASSALGFDLDPLAAPAVRENARDNRLAAHLRTFTGPIEAVDPRHAFDVVLANLLRSELLPIAGALAARVAPGGSLVLSGLLASEQEEVCARFAALGLRPAAFETERDSTGDIWLGLRLTR